MINRQKLIEDMKRKCVRNCLKCEHYTILSSDYHCGLIDDQPPADQWIPCSERLPDNHHVVLACTVNGIVHENNFMGKDWFFYKGGGVTAWMPLPEPYKGVE